MANLKIWIVLGSLLLTEKCIAQYAPTWESLDSRPLPVWYDDAKFGIFIHWGVFSVPSFGSEWFWSFWKGSSTPSYVEFMAKNYPPNFTYQDFARDFTAEFYNPEDWAEIFQASGAKYVVLTSKHHEGYTLWPSKYSFSWNANDVGPHRDLVGELAAAIRNKTDLKFGLYHSLFEWFNPLYLQDQENSFKTQYFVNQKTIPELYELDYLKLTEFRDLSVPDDSPTGSSGENFKKRIKQIGPIEWPYGLEEITEYQPEVVWSDGDEGASDTYWTSKEFIAWLYNESPVKDTVVVNDRWGNGVGCHHGDFYTCADRYNPGVLQPHKWENCMTIDKKSWGYRRDAKLSDFLTTDELVKELVVTVSCGGNLLMNVGPTKDGMIPTVFEERLRDMGSWLKINGEAIYGSKPWMAQNDTVTNGVWYTMSGNASAESAVYAIVLDWPSSGVISLGVPILSEHSKITMLGVEEMLSWSQSESVLSVNFPDKSKVATEWAWVLRMTNVNSRMHYISLL